jgi:hypothetical protein
MNSQGYFSQKSILLTRIVFAAAWAVNSVRGEGGFGSTGISSPAAAAASVAKRQKIEGETKSN